MSKVLTILNRTAWLIAFISITVIIVIVRNYARSRAEISSLRETVASGQKSIDAATKRELGRDSALQQTLRQIEALKRKVQTPAQVAAALPAALPQLPLPIRVSRLVELDKGRNGSTNYPAPMGAAGTSKFASTDASSERSAAVLSVPDVDLKPLYVDLEDCREATASVATLKQDLTDTRGQLSEMTTERDTAMRKVSPNTRWRNVKRAAKWLAVGAALGMAFSQKL
jgi:hypothetical protein